jgi:polar amino acid transport system substrate-binding protein
MGTRRQACASLASAPWALASASLVSLMQAGCAGQPAVPQAVVSALAPTGRLRASINLGNPILASRDAASGAVSGVSVDLARELAASLGVPAELLVTDAAAKSVETVREGRADIGFFAIDPRRSDGIAFTAPYVLIEGAYLVRQASPLTDNAQVDRAGARVMVGRGSAYDLYLTRELKAAQIVRAPTSPTVVDEFLALNADVAAGVKQQLQADAARLGGLRLLPGRFMVIEQAMGLQAGRGTAAEEVLRAFVERVKASGWVAAALQRNRIEGAAVAPAAKS